MKGLIYKDMLVLKKYHCMIYIFVFPVLFSVPYLLAGFNMHMDEIDYLRFTLMTPAINMYTALMLGWTVLDSEEKCNWLRRCMSMPVSRRDYLIAKYNVVFRITVFTVGISYIINLILTTIIGGFSVELFFGWLGCMLLVCLIAVIYGFLQVNVFIKYGKTKLTAMNICIITTLFGTKFLLSYLNMSNTIQTAVFIALALIFLAASVWAIFRGFKWIEEKSV